MDLREMWWEGVGGLGAYGLGLGPMVGSCEHGNEPSDSIKGGELVDYPSDCQLLKKDSVPLDLLSFVSKINCKL
jgi:hypothetical protein